MMITGNIVDLERRRIYFGEVVIKDGHVANIIELGEERSGASYLMSGFIDSHVHIESSQLTPANFGRMVISHGTVGVVTDPHEIANVMGVEGVEFMLESAKDSPIRTHFTIPSSVPATPFDRSGGVLDSGDVEQLAASGRFVALSEVMNVAGVLFRDREVMAKLAVAQRYGLPSDGHAPLLTGEDLIKYAESGITTDHECSELAEAEAKIAAGMKIEIREGSAAKNYEALKSLIATAPDRLLFCTDDAHPEEVITAGNIDKIVRQAISDGFDLFDVLRIASLSPILHYGLQQGALRVGDVADFIEVDDLKSFTTRRVFIGGEVCYDRSQSVDSEPIPTRLINNFNHNKITAKELQRAVTAEPITIIGTIKDELITTAESYTPPSAIENLESDIEADVAKIVYINRYHNTPPVVEYCRGFGLKRGAFASSVAHDSHNITAVGVSDEAIVRAVNMIIESRGGLALCDGDECDLLPLPIAGIMSDRSAEEVARDGERLQRKIASMGCTLRSPFMTLAFMSLVVIPELKIGERGLFSYSKFDWINQ